MRIKNKRGQSTVEYILLVTAVVAVMIVFATNKNAGLQQQINSTFNTATGDIATETDALSSSRQLSASLPGNGTPPYSVVVSNGVGSN